MHRFVFILLASSFLFSCAANRKAQLEENVRNYFLALRHSDSGAVLSYVHPEKQQAFYEASLELENMHISHIRVEAIFPDDELQSALVSAEVEFYSPDASLLQNVKRQFSWKFHPEAKNWLLDEGNPLGSNLIKD